MLKRRLIRPLAVAVMLVFLLGTVAMAGTPNNTIFFGDKAYDVNLLNDPALATEILNAFVANGNQFVYKDPAGSYIDADAKPVDAATLPAGTYKGADKAEVPYGAGDQEVTEPEEFEVIEISAITATVDVGGAYALPETVEVILSDETTKELAVEWDEDVDTSVAGTYEFVGTVTLVEGVVNPDNLTAKVTLEVKAEEPAALVVESVSAINAKTLKVDFNNAISEEDQAKATFDVKRGTIATTVEATWAEDGKSVELVRATNLLAGDYTVTVSGLEFAEDANVGTVKVEAQKIASLEIATDNVVKAASADVVFAAKDQYGDKMDKTRGDFNWTVVNVTDSTRAVTVTGAVGDKVLKLNTNTANVDDVIRVTGLLASDPSVKVIKEITVSNIFVDSFELGEVVLPKDATMLVQNAGYVEVKYSAKDNFGNEVKLADVSAMSTDDVDGIQFITSDATIIPVASATDNFKVTDGKLEVKVLDKAGDVTLTALNTNTGETSSIKIKVNATAGAATAEFGEYKDGAEIVAGDLAKTAKLGITFFDQYGEAIKAADAASKSALTNFNVTVTGAGTTAPTLALSTDGKYIEFNDNAATPGTYTATLVHKTTGASVSTQITVNEKRVANQLKVVTAPNTNLVASQGTKVKFEIIDQYGKKMITDQTGYEVKVSKASDADVKITSPAKTADGTGLAFTVAIADITVTAGAAAATETVTFTLQKTDGTAIDSQAFNFTVVADATGFDVTSDKDEYTAGDDIAVTVKAKDASGFYNKYNETKIAIVTVGSKAYIRTLNFVNGVATTTVPATTAGAANALKVNWTSIPGGEASASTIKVKGAAASKFVLTGATSAKTLGIELCDDYGNKITTFAGAKVVKVTYPAAADITNSGIDVEGNAGVTFTAGKGTITFNANLPVGTYKVTFENYTGTLEVK